MEIKEGHLTFNFDLSGNSLASQYDTWSFYRKQFEQVCGGSKAVDFLFVDNKQKTLWLIEVKDYRHPDTEKVLPSKLGEVVAGKVRDTLAGLVAAKVNAVNDDEKRLANAALKVKNIKVVLHMEQPTAKNKFVDPADVLQKMKQLLKAIDAHPRVVNKEGLKTDMSWTVI